MSEIVAVTGGAGHVGANLVRALLAAGRRVRAIVHEAPGSLDGLDLERVPGDVRDPASLDRAFAGAGVVYHLAARISIAGPEGGRVHQVNVEGTRHVADACLRAGVRRLVHFSSIHALSPHGAGPVDETRPLYETPDALAYERSKAAGERAVLDAVARGLDAVILNPTAVIGPNDAAPSFFGAFLLALHRGRIPALVEGGFDWVDARDVAAGAIAAERAGRRGERYLLSGAWRSVRELAAVAAEVAGLRPPRLVTPMWLARAGAPFALAWHRLAGGRPLYTGESLKALRHWRDVRHDKAAAELGYRPRPLAETLADTFAWFRAAGRLHG